jgi:hypothetical protein
MTPTWTREAAERGIVEILLGTRDGGGVTFLPRHLPAPILFHDVTRLIERDGEVLSFRSDAANQRTAAEALRDARLEEAGAGWFRPFLERMSRGEDFSLDEVEAVHRRLRGIGLLADRGTV